MSTTVQPGGGQKPRISPFDAYLNPNHQPISEDHFIASLIDDGYYSRIEDLYDLHTQEATRMIQQMIGDPAIRLQCVFKLLKRLSSSCRFQCKPKEGDEIILHKVPGSKYTVRVWNGGVAQYRGWCFDLFDISTGTTVNLPRDFAFIDVRGVAGPTGSKLLSLEGMGIPRVEMQPCMENWSAPEGSKIVLEHTGHASFEFTLPVRIPLDQPVQFV